MDRFWTKVDTSSGFGPDGTCWKWTAFCNQDGYGRFRIGRRMVAAHRLSYELSVGPVPAGMCVLHSCDTPACVNPDHLWVGTDADNAADRERKGRGAKVKRQVRYRLSNTSGVMGVCLDNRYGTWRAYFKVPAGKFLSKYTKSFEAAVAQRRAWEAEYL